MTRRHRSQEEWMELIKICRGSGMTDKQWCSENQISLSTFHKQVCYLRRQSYPIPESQAKKRLQACETQEIVPLDIIGRDIRPAQTQDSNTPAVQILAGRLQICFENHASPSLVRNVIRTLEGTC